MRELVAGLDIGSNTMKLLLHDMDKENVVIAQIPTPWTISGNGLTVLKSDDLIQALKALLRKSMRKAETHWRSPVNVNALAISGMGETGYLMKRPHTPVGPAYAWFDKSGRNLIEALPNELRTSFEGITGLPLGAQVSVAKILLLQSQGVDLKKSRWINIPEFIAYILGADHVGEYSLMSRTGLIDQSSGGPWEELLRTMGADLDLIPRLVNAGSFIGTVSNKNIPAEFLDAKITIAGHDHLVAASSNGPMLDDVYYVSMGTAEVLLRILDEPLNFSTRAYFAKNLINSVRHVVPGKHVIVAGVKTGLLMRRALNLFGISNEIQRNALDATLMKMNQPAAAASGISVTGARNGDGELSLTIARDEVGPAEVFSALLDHGNRELLRLIKIIEESVSPAKRSMLTGGWSQMESVAAARSSILPNCVRSAREQDTAFGAALFARRLIRH